MLSSRAIASEFRDTSESAGARSDLRARAVQQDQQGPLDGELLDLYVAILIVVPVAWFLRALWS